ncbi:hypothetical protein BB8028_0002g02560 [Beauveria bassiana]|uniref:Uncharacterized protein n=1 Tax=Beauveria bassiana TaxID=176275 RepID=A0A2S7Y240_BEABA|nr:hypothetical protein BB8028_0002g02560 [Beauveria bassiana]
MRLAYLASTSTLTGTISRGTPGKRAETPDPKWDRPPYNLNPKDDGPPYNPEDAGGSTDNIPLAALDQMAALTPATIDNFKVPILADSNRDGKGDIAGDTDLAGKETWTAE